MGDPVEMLFLEHQRHGITQAIVGVEDEVGRRAVRDLPDHFFASIGIDPNEGMDAVRKIDKYANEFDLKAVGAFPSGLYPQVALERQDVLPDLREVHRGRRPVLLDGRRPRAAPAVRTAGSRAHRRGLLVLSRAEVRDAPRLRTVDGARRQAVAQVAEPLLLDDRVRAEVLPGRHHQLREHSWRRQGDLLGLLPGRPHLRAHLQRDAGRPVPRQRMARLPARERATRLQAPPEDRWPRSDYPSVREGARRGRRHRHDDRLPRAARGAGEALRLHPQADARRRQQGVGVPRAVHVQGGPALRAGRRSRSRC